MNPNPLHHIVSRAIGRMALFVFLLQTLVIGLAIAWGTAFEIVQPLPPGFIFCDLPCWAGIIPGETAPRHIETALQTTMPGYASVRPRMDRGYDVHFSYGFETGYAVLYTNMHVITEINVNVPVPFSHLAVQLGTPDCITRIYTIQSNRLSRVAMHWRHGDYTISASLRGEPSDALFNNETVTAVNVTVEAVCQAHYAIQWQGFAPLWYYEQLNAS